MSKKKIAILVVSIFAFSLLLTLLPTSATAYGGGNESSFGRPISSYMMGTHYSDSIILPTQPNTTIDLPTGWVIQHTNITVYDLVDSRDFIINGTFDAGSGTSSPPWAYGEVDPGGIASGSWVSGSPQTGNVCVYSQIPASSGGTTFTKGTKSYWNATFTVPRGRVHDAVIDLWYYADFASNFDRGEFRAYIEIEGKTVWSRGFNEIADAGERNTWVHLTLNVFTDTNGQPVFNLPTDQNITVELGVRYTSGTASYTGWTSNNRLYYDNVSVILTAEVNPSQVALAVTDPGSNTHNVASSSYGTGTVDFDGVFGPATQPVFEEIVYAYSSNSSNVISFKNNITAEIKHVWNTSAVTFSVDNGTDVSWTVKLLTELNVDNEPKGTGPTIYSDYCFNLTLPLDWNVLNITDPTGGSHNVNDTNYTLYSNSTNKILVINVDAIGSYGLYTVECSSPNYLNSIQLQVYNSTLGWVNSNYFEAGDTVRFICNISDLSGSPPSSMGTAEISILNPLGSSWPSHSLSVTVNSSGIGVSDAILIQESDLVGPYTVEFRWNNGFEAGILSTSRFGIRGTASVNILSPTTDERYIQSGSSFVIEVALADPVTSNPITDALVLFHLSWEDANSWHNATLAGDKYISSIQVPEGVVGDQSITIKITHDFYSLTAESSIKITVWEEWYIYFPWGGRILGWVFVFYVALAGLVVLGGYSAWNYYFKYPKMVRKIRGMIKAIRKGNIPKEPGVRDRTEIISDLIERDKHILDTLGIAEESEVIGEVATAASIEPGAEPGVTAEPITEEFSVSEERPEPVEISETEQAPSEPTTETLDETTTLIDDSKLESYRDELRAIGGISEQEINALIEEFKDLPEDEVKRIIDTLKEQYNS
ncbi:MAG: hypothetical protein ACTSQY_06570 [Candidatus Odinarchaeia archaeon]